MILPERLATRIQITEKCWLWTGSVEKNGYGKLSGQWAHRLVYQTAVGPIPDNMELDHVCRNPRCVNPAHLEPVTHAENMRRSSLGAANLHRRKTHCPSGHPYNESNTIKYRGFRYCRICAAAHKRAHKKRRRAS